MNFIDEKYTHNFADALLIKERVNIYKDENILNFDYENYDNWINKRGVISEKDIFEKLEIQGITSDELNNALKTLNEQERVKIRKELEEQDWFIRYNEIMHSYKSIQHYEYKDGAVDLSISLIPFVLWFRKKIENVIQDMNNVNVGKNVYDNMVNKVSTTLLELSIKTLVYELHNYKIEEKIDKEDYMYRQFIINNFIEYENMVSFYAKYPVLARRITIQCGNLLEHYTEMFNRVDKDFKDICETFELDLDNEITELASDQGDTHEKGKFVILIKFGEIKVVYKPRNLAIQEKFNQIVDYINKNFNIEIMKTNTVFYGDEYVFEKYVEYKSCENEDELKCFYKRFGQMAALIYLLKGNDIHYENIIANGEFPVIVDVETLFQQQSEIMDTPQNAFNDAYKESLNSVAGSHLIPVIALSKGRDGKGINISALSGDEQVLPFKIMVIKDANKDSMRFEYDYVSMSAAKNIPMINGEKASFANYVDDILAGFHDLMYVVYMNKNSFIGENGILNIFKGVKIRQLLKATMNYAKQMSFSSHPNYSMDIIWLERMLCNAWSYNYRDKTIVLYEIEDMLLGDIPIFYGIVDSRDILSSNGYVFENYFDKSGFDRAVEIIKNLSEDNIKKQEAHIKVCLGLYEKECIKRFKSNLGDFNKNKKSSFSLEYKEMLLSEAEKIADRIIDNAIYHEKSGSVAWSNIIFDTKNDCWKISPVGVGIKDGYSGIMLYLLQINKYTDNKYDNFIKKVINTIVLIPEGAGEIGLLNGASGVVMALLSVYNNMQSNDYREIVNTKIYNIANDIINRMNKIESFNYAEGLAGVVAVFSEAYKITGNKKCLEISMVSTNKIIDKYDMTLEKNSGFMYGLLGIIIALRRYLQINKTDSMNEYIDKLVICYNRLLQEQKKVSINEMFENCGAVSDIDNDFIDEFLDTELITDSLYDGNCGKIFSIINHYNITNKNLNEIIEKLNFIAAQMIERALEKGYNFYSLEQYVTVGLFYGLSGIGYALLKLYDNKNIDNFLLFDMGE